MFTLIFNIADTICYSLWIIILSILTGKKAKVSPYHFGIRAEYNGFFDICSDVYKKTNQDHNVTPACKEIIIADFIRHLSNDKNFTSVVNKVNFPIFDGNEIIGNQSHHSILEESLKDFITKEKLKNEK